MGTITKNENVEEKTVDTSEELPATDEFSDEQFMVGDDSKGMFSMEPEVGDAFEVMSGTTFEQDENRNERLADLVPELKKENEALKIELTKNALCMGGSMVSKNWHRSSFRNRMQLVIKCI